MTPPRAWTATGGHDRLDPVGELDRHDRARLDALLAKEGGDASNVGAQLGVGPGPGGPSTTATSPGRHAAQCATRPAKRLLRPRGRPPGTRRAGRGPVTRRRSSWGAVLDSIVTTPVGPVDPPPGEGSRRPAPFPDGERRASSPSSRPAGRDRGGAAPVGVTTWRAHRLRVCPRRPARGFARVRRFTPVDSTRAGRDRKGARWRERRARSSSA